MADSIRNRRSLAAGLLALGLTAGAQADEATPEMLANACAGCHGTEGNSMGPAAPTISAMDPLVFVDTMEAFKSDDTYSTIMSRIAKGYDTTEFEAMAEYFHRQPYRPAPQDFDASLVDVGAQLHDRFCEKCHAEGGIPLIDEEDYNILAGQWTPYLRYTMEDFRAERRELPKKMRSKLEDLLEHHGEDGLEALYAFYASQQ
ncbi:c-type cytochrome [Marichromatium bheemlicum]|uniref:Cytochrome c4 n=1 Tax=Marichromatium bheemlicum TaxID=365339 RepID=A0ABX1IA05_9GAMM|nr:cytochrome c4 [Marichromatium bheemlicum]NKN34374.1 cytochrome c4 [Marichromatium bheemlicum]